MAKFLRYEDRLNIDKGLKDHKSFAEIGRKV